MTLNPSRSRSAFSFPIFPIFFPVLILLFFVCDANAGTGLVHAHPTTRTAHSRIAHRRTSAAGSTLSGTRYRHHRAAYRYRGRLYRGGVPTWSDDPARDDAVGLEDPLVRQVALEALGHANGSVVAVDPTTGRILSVVNQKLAFSPGFEPCSTIKPVIALAALQTGLITHDTLLRVGGRHYMSLTDALAHSNNAFFESLGERLGFATVSHYARLLGLGEPSGLHIPNEPAGALPPAPPAGGVARMSSFGQGIRITPLQLASLAATLANGGTMYYLQYPRAAAQSLSITPQVRRQLDINSLLPDVREGMLAAVLYGTARQSYDPDGEQSLGKTGTCDDESQGGRLGWYVSYLDETHPRVVLVVLLRGRSRWLVNGPHAADIAGKIYRQLRARNYFAGNPLESPNPLAPSPLAPLNTQPPVPFSQPVSGSMPQ